MDIDFKNIVIITLIVIFSVLVNNYMKQKLVLDSIKNCSGSPSCVESTVSVFLYKSTPCLDEIKYGGKK